MIDIVSKCFDGSATFGQTVCLVFVDVIVLKSKFRFRPRLTVTLFTP